MVMTEPSTDDNASANNANASGMTDHDGLQGAGSMNTPPALETRATPVVRPERIDFLVIGVQKGGTTALDRYLRHAPGVQMARVKEVHFFDDETVDWSEPDYGVLHGCFDFSSPEPRVRGEATPISSYWPHCLERIARYNPDAKLVMCLRHPAHRAYSQWRMETARRFDDLPFSAAIGPVGRRRVRDSPGGVHRVFSYVERGFYADQIERAMRFFSVNRIHFLLTDDLWIRPSATLAALHGFLGIPPAAPAPTASDLVQPVPAIPWNDIQGLTRLFTDDIRRTEALTGLSLGHWLDPDYREAVRQPPPQGSLRP